MEENKHSMLNRFPDPEAELSDDFLHSLSQERLKELEDDRALDLILKKSLPSKKISLSGDFNSKLKASLGAAQNLSSDPAADGMRSSAAKLRERFIYSEKSYLSWSSAAAALLAVLFLPAVLSENIRSRTETPVADSRMDDSFEEKRSTESDEGPTALSRQAPVEAEAEEKKARRVYSPSGADEMMISSRSFSMDMMEEPVSEENTAKERSFEMSTAPGEEDAVLIDMLRRTASPEDRLEILRRLEEMYGDMGLAAKKENISKEISRILKENPGLK